MMRDYKSRRSYPPRYGVSVVAVAVFLVLILGGVGYGIYQVLPRKKSNGPTIITHTVQRGTFAYDVVERGEIESSDNVEVRCEVKAQKNSGLTILEVVDEGTVVKKGDVLVRLDASGLEQDLLQQQIKCNSQEAAMITSRNNYESAVISKKEYVEGTFEQEQQTIQSEIFIAEENLRRAQEYLNYSERLSARGYVTPQQLEGDRFAVLKAKTEVTAAKTKLEVLQEYTKPKMLKQLDSDIKSAEAAWQADQNSHKLELANLQIIEEQIEKCVMRAPQGGQVIHANETSRRGDSEFIVEPGANVREGQAIIRLPNPEAMQVKAKINESQIADLRVGLPATIRIDAYGDTSLRGEVTKVNEYPEPTSWYSSQVKEYASFIKVLDTDDLELRPGLTAEVTIHVAFEKDATLVPIQAIHEHGRTNYCMVKVGEDQWEARKVDIAGNNDSFVMVKSGVVVNDEVALNPRECLDMVTLPEIEELAPIGRDVTKTGRMSDRGPSQGGPAGRGANPKAASGKPKGKTSGRPGGKPSGNPGGKPGKPSVAK